MIPLPAFLSRNNLKLYIFVTHKLIKKAITNLDLSKVSGPDCIPIVQTHKGIRGHKGWGSTFSKLMEMGGGGLKIFTRKGELGKMGDVCLEMGGVALLY